MTETGWSAVDGSPGPLEKKTPSGSTAYTSSSVAVAGRTCTSMPRSAIRCGVMPLMPRSIAATVNFLVPIAGTTYVSLVATSAERSAPLISGAWRTRARSVPSSAMALPEKMPTRIAPRSRRWRVRARVSMPLMPTTPWLTSSSSSERRERQLEGTRAGSRTT